MKYLDEYRDAKIATALAAEIRRRSTRPWVLMEICGGQTHTLMRYGIDDLLKDSVQLVHGPGCPVCVTALETIDRAIALAQRPEVTLVSYGDMLRVPGTGRDLFQVRGQGGDVRVVAGNEPVCRRNMAPPECLPAPRALVCRRLSPDREPVGGTCPN